MIILLLMLSKIKMYDNIIPFYVII